MKYLATALIVAGLGFPGAELFGQVAPPNSSSSSTNSGLGSALKKQILSLVQAKMADPIIISYIRRNVSPGNRISSQDVVELKQAGASDAVLTALVEATASASDQAAPSGSAGGPSTTIYPENSTTYVYSYPDYPYGYYYGSYWPYYYYPYAYPYWGFGVSVPLFFHDHDGHLHHDHFSHVDHFHGGHSGAGAAPHGGFGSHGAAGHGGGHR